MVVLNVVQKKPNILVLWFGVFDNACCSCTTYPEFLPPCFLSLLFLPLLQDGCRPCCCSFSVLYILSIRKKKSKVKITLLIMALGALETTQWRLKSAEKLPKSYSLLKFFLKEDGKGVSVRGILPRSFQSLKRFENGGGVGSVWGGYCLRAHFNPSKGLKMGLGWGVYEGNTAQVLNKTPVMLPINFTSKWKLYWMGQGQNSLQMKTERSMALDKENSMK